MGVDITMPSLIRSFRKKIDQLIYRMTVGMINWVVWKSNDEEEILKALVEYLFVSSIYLFENIATVNF